MAAAAPGPGGPTFGSLPLGIVQHIVELLEPEDQARAACACRPLQQAVEPRAPALLRAAEAGYACRVLALLRKPSARAGIATVHVSYREMEVWGVHRRWKTWDCPLSAAIKNGHAEVASILLACGANAEATGEYSLEQLLWTACSYDHPQCVQRLLATGVPVDTVYSSSGMSCLTSAAGYELLAVMGVLIDLGADVNFAVSAGEEEELRGTTPLLMAANKGHLDAAALLLAHGAAVNHACARGRTPLHEACRLEGNDALVQLLLGAGAAPEAVDATGGTALMRAAQSGDQQMVDVLIRAGGAAGVDAADAAGRTALILACAGGNAPTAARLVEARAALNAADKHGRTALMAAAAAGHTEVVAMLAALKGIELGVADAQGRTALDHARESGHADAAACLAAAGRRRSPRLRASRG